ncbi:unnamed protein product [Discula destructiva]
MKALVLTTVDKTASVKNVPIPVPKAPVRSQAQEGRQGSCIHAGSMLYQLPTRRIC